MPKQYLKTFEKKIRRFNEESEESQIKSATYILTGNQYLKTNKERLRNTIQYLLNNGIEFVNVMYFAGYDGLELDVNHPYDLIFQKTSEEELDEILARADTNALPRFITSINIEEESVMLDILSNGRILAQPNEDSPKVEDAAWKLEGYL